MRFLPYHETSSVPNVIVDGAKNNSTVLTLSHWPKSGTHAELKADTSTAIVFNYLDRPEFRVEVDIVSNNHFDEDGLVGIFALLAPGMADRHRELIVDVAEAGDFGISNGWPRPLRAPQQDCLHAVASYSGPPGGSAISV